MTVPDRESAPRPDVADLQNGVAVLRSARRNSAGRAVDQGTTRVTANLSGGVMQRALGIFAAVIALAEYHHDGPDHDDPSRPVYVRER